MKKKLILTSFIFCVFIVNAQNSSVAELTYYHADSLLQKIDSTKTSVNNENETNLPRLKLKNEDAPLGKKILRSFIFSFAENTCSGLVLTILPDDFTKWKEADKFQWPVMKKQYINSYTKPPVFDKDLWEVNYILHPYQGAFYFNNIRSQGATFWQSSLYCLMQSCIWEYIWEGGMEQPSIQDLIVTPVVGSVLGELSNKATMQMRKNGFRWYEKVLVCIINPSYPINNGFRTSNRKVKF